MVKRTIFLALTTIVFLSGCSDSKAVDPCDSDPKNCRNIGWDLLQQFHKTKDKETALRAHQYLLKGCDGGIIKDCRDLGGIFSTGAQGGEINYPKSLTFYKNGCDLKDDYSCEKYEEITKKLQGE